jgi:hypothetical protein
MTKQEAIEYLEKVLDTWGIWREHHEPLCRAIEVLLEEVKDES